MGHHATIGRSLKPAPRAIVTQRVTPYMQQLKSDALAGPVTESTRNAFQSVTNMELMIMIAGRKITRMTATMNDYRKETATRFTLKLDVLGARIVVRKINPTKNNPRCGWGAYLVQFGEKNGPELAFVAKGSSIETNGERQDACRAALNTLHVALQAA